MKPAEALRKTIEKAALQRCIADYSLGKFKMRPGEVGIGWKDKSKKAFVLFHRITGINMVLRVKTGHNPSKKNISDLRQRYIKMYWSILEAKVRLRLRLYMARQFGPIPEGQFNENQNTTMCLRTPIALSRQGKRGRSPSRR